jgi:uncharacterized protein (DUF2126 family)/transglutaminase-like putative cysteine protease
MSIRVAIRHQTSYRFDRPVALTPHVVRLRPAPHTRTPIEAYSLRVEPDDHFINWQQDPFGNYLARLVFHEKTRSLSFDVEVIADMTVINPFDFFVEEYAERFPFEYAADLKRDLAPYLTLSEDGPLLRDWVAGIDRSANNSTDFLVNLNHQLYQGIEYSIRMEPGVQTCEQTLEKALGSCRDSGWLLVQILRHLGLAARFVSGYLVQLASDQKSLDGPSGPERDFTDLHAWAEVYLPGAGWLGLDPTSGLFAGEGHIPLACTAVPGSAAPITGATEPCEVSFEFENSVTRIHEDPRVTKPYSDHQWQAINALAYQVDGEFETGDVRLTMGGEPTFVSIDDMEAPEWNTAADGPHKRELAHDLLLRLRDRFAPGALLHHGQGKWYPGEPLPRWALGCFWRRDGVALWRDPALLADTSREYGHDRLDAERFARALTAQLGAKTTHLLPAFEDPVYHLWQESILPVNLDPLEADLNNADERAHLARVLSEGLGNPVGYTLPIRWDVAKGVWRSSHWTFRRGHLFLVAGESPMGLRLPLDSIPWVAPEARDPDQPRSLFDALPELGDPYGEVTRRYSHLDTQVDAHPEVRDQPPADEGPAEDDIAHTAVCVEARNGLLHVFLPPMTDLEHYLDMVASLEVTAANLEMPIVLEGYEPPRDWRIERLLVTPDPGVIEVNVHPAGSWDELVATTETLYEEARNARLGTEKFMLDGRHTGTGGGNHVTLGGKTPADSPMLRRPDLLRSLLTYWQHHPGLSFLFSGMFIGPTSQAPRVDEGRPENLYELEVAFQHMPAGEVAEPWLVDRLLRHLLTDITGNTHRSEFCIDKLYSPDSPTGRLGLVELRAFEMPPHARMSLVQMLLLRALVARFWKTPYAADRLVRWGTELYDRFMLPHFVESDIREVMVELADAGYPFDPAWLDPFFEFRFPRYGTTRIQDIEIELRMALEPWHVLGEEMSSGGTARFVDSSVERLQVKLKGLTESRYRLSCNGRGVPLRSVGRVGEYVAGIRYKAWQPPSGLHPTIAVHTPLVFDLIDTWNGRSIGGCTYYVAHPGGRSYDVFPVNTYEAEARRITRFQRQGHTQGPIMPPPTARGQGVFSSEATPPGPMMAPELQVDSEYPSTLDLRRPLAG